MKTHTSLTAGLRRKNYGFTAALAVISLTAISFTANAQDTWQGTTDAWDTDANWSTGLIPTGTDDVILPAIIPSGGGAIVQTGTDSANSLTIDNTYVLESGTITLASGTITNNATTISTISSVISGSEGLTVVTTGTAVSLGQIALTAANTFTGPVTIDGGYSVPLSTGGLRISADSELGVAPTSPTADLFLNSGILTIITNSFTLNANRSIVMTGSNEFNVASGITLTYAGTISDGTSAGTLVKNSAGTLILEGANSYSGGTQFVNGGGTIQVGGGTITTNGSLGSGTIEGLGTAGTLTINNTNTYTISNTISGAVTFRQVGSGTTILTGSNSYTGATTVTTGALLVNGNQTAATAAVSVTGGTLGGDGTIGGATTVSSAGNITAGSTIGSIGTLTTGALTISGTYKLTLNSTANTSDRLISTGALTLGGTLAVTDLDFAVQATSNLIIAEGTSLSGSFTGLAQGASVDGGLYTIDYGNVTPDAVMLIAVPEPSTVVLAGIFGFGVLMLFRRRRNA